METVNHTIEEVQKLKPDDSSDKKLISRRLKAVAPLRSRFTTKLPESVTSLDGKQNRLFRRLLTLHGIAKRPHLRQAALTAIRRLPDMRILRRALAYLSQLDFRTHDHTLEELFKVLETEELPFPYQSAMVLECITKLHPISPNGVASRIRTYALTNRRHWVVIQRALEAILVYPYRTPYALNIASTFLDHEHPMVRRAACVLLTRCLNVELRKGLNELIYHADPGLSRLALYFHRFIYDKSFAVSELARMRNGATDDFAFQRRIPALYALTANQDRDIGKQVYDYISALPATKSRKNQWQRQKLLRITEWATK